MKTAMLSNKTDTPDGFPSGVFLWAKDMLRCVYRGETEDGTQDNVVCQKSASIFYIFLLQTTVVPARNL